MTKSTTSGSKIVGLLALTLPLATKGQGFGFETAPIETTNSTTNATLAPSEQPSSAPSSSPTEVPCFEYLVQATSDWLTEDEDVDYLEVYLQIFDNNDHRVFGKEFGDLVKNETLFDYELNTTIAENPWHNESNVLEGCLPLDKCYMAIVDDYDEDGDIELYVNGEYMLNDDQFKISCASGTVYCPSEEDDSEDTGRSLRFVEFGNCDIECAADEKLLELEFYGYPAIDWEIYDDANSEVVEKCGEACQYKWNERYYKQRRCLKADQCYRLVTFTEATDAASFNATFGGEKIASALESRFSSDLVFGGGDNCANVGGDAPTSCGAGESVLEVFLERNYPSRDSETIELPPFELSISENSKQIDKLDGVATEEGLFYSRTCVPSSSCLGVTLSNPSRTESINGMEYREEGEWTVTLDGDIYRDGVYYFAKSDSPPRKAGYSDTVPCGRCSTTQEMGCNGNTEAVFELTITPDPNAGGQPYQDFDWNLYYPTDEGFNYIPPFGYSTGQYLPGVTYTHYFCIPTEECPVFETTDYGKVPFVVKVDGEETTEKDLGSVKRDGYHFTNINLVCSQSLSTGAIAGIAVGAAVGVILIIVGIWWYCKNKKSKDGEDEPKKVPVSAVSKDDPEVAAAGTADAADEAKSADGGNSTEEDHDLEDVNIQHND